MPITLLTTPYVEIGAKFSRFADEFVYAMGQDFDFEKTPLSRTDLLTINLICVPPNFGILNKTSFKRAHAEFWTSYNIDYGAFVSGDLTARLSAVRDGLIGAIEQVPTSRMSTAAKEDFYAAAHAAALRLLSEPDRLPR